MFPWKREPIFFPGWFLFFFGFHPLGVVLVALLGVGVAEKSGFINADLKTMLVATPRIVSVAGPAKTAQLKIDDLITEVGVKSVATIQEARDAFESLKPDVPVVAVKRGESEIYAAFEAKPVPGHQ